LNYHWSIINYIFSLLFKIIKLLWPYFWIKHYFAVNYNRIDTLYMYYTLYNVLISDVRNWKMDGVSPLKIGPGPRAFTFLNPAQHIRIRLIKCSSVNTPCAQYHMIRYVSYAQPTHTPLHVRVHIRNPCGRHRIFPPRDSRRARRVTKCENKEMK